MASRSTICAALTLSLQLTCQTPGPELAQAAAAYAAKVTASALFVSGRTLESVLEQEFAPTRPLDALIRPLIQLDVDRAARTVTCRLGVGRATAAYTEGLGCTLVHDRLDPDRRRYARPLAQFSADAPTRADLWPGGAQRAPAGPGVDVQALDAALELAFAEPDPRRPVFTRAVVVVHEGRLIAERYAPGFDADMPLPGWSMSKTLTNALIGVHVGERALDVHGRPAVSSWREEGDPRGGLLLRHLLAMSAGLAWNEDYADPSSDALRSRAPTRWDTWKLGVVEPGRTWSLKIAS